MLLQIPVDRAPNKDCLLYQKKQENTSWILAEDQSRVLGVQKYLQSICKNSTDSRLKSLTFSTLKNPIKILHASGTKMCVLLKSFLSLLQRCGHLHPLLGSIFHYFMKLEPKRLTQNQRNSRIHVEPSVIPEHIILVKISHRAHRKGTAFFVPAQPVPVTLVCEDLQKMLLLQIIQEFFPALSQFAKWMSQISEHLNTVIWH